ncbi:MAG TPA: hypothetical protein VEB66_16900 [Opitutaceae bacterium]|nr:hypothetical protein [Opitutaceae bacterium]
MPRRRAAPPRVFLLSPAHVGGIRARLLLNPHAPFALAREFRTRGLALADVFTFTSGLYFRGKIAYARHFAGPRELVRVITSNAGLLDPDTRVGPAEVRAYGATDIDAADPRYRVPLVRDARAIATLLGPDGTAVLLGSIATPKYRDALLEVFGPRLLFPVDFVGRGDMSRGALLLRAARADRELPYAAVADAILTGRRAPGVDRMNRG